MTTKKPFSIATILLSIILIISLLNVQVAFADGETPTEPPAPTQVETEPPPLTEPPAEPALPTEAPIEATPEPVEATPIPAETMVAPIEEILTQVPDDTEVVVLDESGEPLPLATQEAAAIMEVIDPMWCPAGVSPGGTGCINHTGPNAINNLINDIISNTSNYAQHGVIYFTPTAIQPFTLTTSSLGASVFDTLNDFDLTLQGGWNGTSGTGAAFSGQTAFGTNPITIGDEINPWAGNITLNYIKFNGVSSTNALTIYTDGGDINLSSVTVSQQTGGFNTALLDSNMGDITVKNGSSFDGNASGTTNESQGFAATTGGGSISISDTAFYDSKKIDPGTYDGARLSAPTVVLTNVSSETNDGNGIVVSNASLVTLNNVISTRNGLSGVLINGTSPTIVLVTGGTFERNNGYGIKIDSGSLFVNTDPVCPLTGGSRNILGCYSVTPSTDTTAPVITPVITGTVGANGWYTSDVLVSWSVADPESGIFSSTGCASSNLTANTAGTTLTCSAINNLGLSNSASVTIKIEKPVVVVPPTSPAPTSPAPTSPALIPTGATSESSTSESDLQGSIIPLTGAKKIDLDCDSVFWAFGVKLSFTELCDYQTSVKSIGINKLPGELPDGFTFVMGLDLSLFKGNQTVQDLPDGASVQLDFPTAGGAKDQFAALYWNGSEWVELSQQDASDQNLRMLSAVTDKTGIFVLVKK